MSAEGRQAWDPPMEGFDGYGGQGDARQPVDATFAGLWPPGTIDASTGPAHQEQPSRTLVYPDEQQGKKKKKPKTVPQPGK